MAAISRSVPGSPPVRWSARTTAIAAAMPPAVRKSGGPPKRRSCSRTSQSFTGFFGMPW